MPIRLKRRKKMLMGRSVGLILERGKNSGNFNRKFE